MKNEMMVFEGKAVEVFELNGQVLFNPWHVGECLDLDEVTVRRHIQEMNEKQVVKLTNSDVHSMNTRKLNNAGENFLSEFLNRPFGLFMDDCFECRIWFSARVAKYINERPWSDNQKINENDDGSIVLQIQTCGWFDVKRWVLSFGKDARVLEPEKMRAEILEEVRLMTENYLK